MIDKVSGEYLLICDNCGEDCGEAFYVFFDAFYYKRGNGWKSKKTATGWDDVCPECQL